MAISSIVATSLVLFSILFAGDKTEKEENERHLREEKEHKREERGLRKIQHIVYIIKENRPLTITLANFPAPTALPPALSRLGK